VRENICTDLIRTYIYVMFRRDMGTRGRDGQYGVLQERAMCTTSPSKLIIILIHQVEDAVVKQNQPAQWATCTGGSESAEVAAARLRASNEPEDGDEYQ
jgi:hypothetical protein